ncbi:paired small multidrug resistance pump [Salinibacillus kushneri]|uniref:Paired small multidrug resistance pump n=1 Tax=Salinibacillus kushneri TaxID=237682 RepID=A0A1I0AEA9_9BACI|nr:multidrug efflux SMR transporter [Salinibacillus kushneri]SES92542.1 paired small multidrug resistance pump [Salinibacillus kushneri]
MAWLAIVIAGICEVTGVLNLKRLAMKKWDALIVLIVTFGLSLTLLAYAMQTLSMATVYGVWTGIGTVGSTVMGMILYGEPREWKRLLFIAMILSSAVGLKLIS